MPPPPPPTGAAASSAAGSSAGCSTADPYAIPETESDSDPELLLPVPGIMRARDLDDDAGLPGLADLRRLRLEALTRSAASGEPLDIAAPQSIRRPPAALSSSNRQTVTASQEEMRAALREQIMRDAPAVDETARRIQRKRASQADRGGKKKRSRKSKGKGGKKSGKGKARARAAPAAPTAAAAPAAPMAAAASAASVAPTVPPADALIGEIITDSSDDERFEIVRRATPAESSGNNSSRGALYKVRRLSNNRVQPKPWAEGYLRSKVMGMTRAQYARSIGRALLDSSSADDDSEEEEEEEEE